MLDPADSLLSSWPSIYKQYLRYVADRTGILSFANLPLLWIFAGRNNIFLWATGWSFATFNIFHRHVAVISVVQAVVHTVLYVVLFVDGMLALVSCFNVDTDSNRRNILEEDQ